MRVLLTGSSGWLGRFLAPRLRQAGHDVTGLDAVSGEATDVIGSVAERAVTDFAAVLGALRSGEPLPFAHDPDYVSPSMRLANG